MYIFIANYECDKSLDFKGNIDFLFNIAYDNPKNFPYLSNIDPYWKTIFNKIQIERWILNEINNIEEKNNEIYKFKEFISKVEQHNFLIIVWD